MANPDWEKGYVAGWRAAILDAARDITTDMGKDIVKKAKGKTRRKVSDYSKRYGREYKRLKAKHPRMKFGALAKKAHTATRRALK